MLGVRVTYFFGFTVCLISIFLSGFNDNPLKDNNNLKTKMDQYGKNSALFTTHNYLKNENFIGFPIKNPIELKVQNTIRIPIEVRNSNGSGTAFKVGKDIWITARHVIHGCRKVFLYNQPVEEVFIPPSSDLALLVSNSFDVDKFELNQFLTKKNSYKYKNDPVVGDLGYSIGFPKGQPGQARLKFAGYVQMIQRGAYFVKEPVKMWVETERQPSSLDQMGGISGGPIFNNEGYVVGVHVANSVRRGRAFSVDEYALSWLLIATSNENELTKNNPKINLTDNNWSRLATTWRNKDRIKKVNCII